MKKVIHYTKLLLFVLISSCSSSSEKEDEVVKDIVEEIQLATIQTNEAEEIDVFKASVFGLVLDNGGNSIKEYGVCYGTIENPNYDGLKKTSNSVKGSGEFKVNISDLTAGTIYYARAYGINDKGIGYGNQISFKTQDATYPLISIGEVKVSGAHDIFIDVLLEEGDLEISEIGIVYGTSHNPTINDNKIVNDNVVLKYKQRIINLEPQMSYNIRPYVETSEGILYGEEISIQTIKKGNFTFSMWEDPNADTALIATYARIRNAFEEATDYYNNFTSIQKHVTVNYSPGTPTADANFDGWINMGANASYQRTGTAMHEMAHTVGVGTHWKYYDDLMKTSPWSGTRANEILQMMTDTPNATVNGDHVHFWPYGVNGAHEDDGSEMLYVIHALIIQGMKTDGLPSN